MIKKGLNILLFMAAVVAVYFISEKYFFRLDLTAFRILFTQKGDYDKP